MASSGIWCCPLWQVTGEGWGLGLCQVEEVSLEFVRSGVGIGVETAEFSMTTQSLLLPSQVTAFVVLLKPKVVRLRDSNLLSHRTHRRSSCPRLNNGSAHCEFSTLGEVTHQA